eukprot:6633350-Pyramimonas_sp.AAC.2
MAHDSSRWLKLVSDIAPRGLKMAPRRVQVPAEPSKDPPQKKPKWFQNLKKYNNLCVPAFSLAMGL